MVGSQPINTRAVKERVTGEEWAARVDLAAAYQLVAHFRMTDTIYNHISLRIPGRHDVFLLNAFGLMYDDVTASNLVTVNLDGDILDDPTGLGVNRAGFVIHGAIHEARPDVACVLHTHTVAGGAVSAQSDGLLPISQHAAELIGRIGHHPFEGISVGEDERVRLVRDLGPHYVLILENHGLLTAGRTIGEAFQLMLRLERACAIQIAALAGGAKVRVISQASVDATHAVVDGIESGYERDWAALKRLALRVAPSLTK